MACGSPDSGKKHIFPGQSHWHEGTIRDWVQGSVSNNSRGFAQWQCLVSGKLAGLGGKDRKSVV